MKYPNFGLEKKLFAQGYQKIAAVDEVGRGAWAGPLVAAAVILLKDDYKLIKLQKLKIKDSKLLNEKNREQIFEFLRKKIIWSTGLVTNQEIDHFGLGWANKKAVIRAIKKLKNTPHFLLIDMIRGFQHELPHYLMVNGDQKVFSIALASIFAKVTRDRLMKKYHLLYPIYQFHLHKGYGTALHQNNLKKYGYCPIHRQSFSPINNYPTPNR